MQEKFGFKSHWRKIGINTIDELKSCIETIFTENDHQQHAIIRLYQMVFPDWDQIFKIHGYPNTGEDLWMFICRKFQEFDRINHPNCMPGGAWINLGFSVNSELPPWEIGFENCTIEYVDKKGGRGLVPCELNVTL